MFGCAKRFFYLINHVIITLELLRVSIGFVFESFYKKLNLNLKIMNINKKRGFTLIELLVVIAIIGILSSVVLASLNTARDKGRDASAKGSISAIRAQAEIYYDSYSDYVNDAAPLTVCADAQVSNLLTAAGNQAGTTGCNAVSGAYAAEISLNGGGYFCVDSSGFAGEVTTSIDDPTATTTCPSS
jgi:prepilin-type N-terminal cleavage/methylation domain-containing protein